MRLLTGLPRQRTPWPARALALALGVLGPIALAVSVRAPAGSAAREPRDASSAERVVALDPLAAPAWLAARAAAAPTLAPTAAPTRTSAATAGPGRVGRVGADMPRARVDSATRAADAPAVATGRAPTARELFRPPTASAPLCLPPCGAAGPTVAAGEGGRAGAGIVFPPLSKARRDSIAQAVVAEAAARGGSTSNPASPLPGNAVGVSLQVGLPGGGPTRAQRERARVLDGDVSARLARIRARSDSLAVARARDSVARAMSARDAARTPG